MGIKMDKKRGLSSEVFKKLNFLNLSFFIIISAFIIHPQETSLFFDGVYDNVNCGSSSILTPPNAITISVWFKTSEVNRGQTILWRGDVWQNYYGIKLGEDNRIRGTLFLDQFTHIFSEASIENNVWYNVAFTYNNDIIENNFKLYINGQLESELTATGNIKWDSNPLLIGYYPWSNPYVFHGYIRNIQIWNRALSQEEIQGKMNQALNPEIEQGLIGYWPADEGEGDILHDLSGNGNHGYIYGADWYPVNSLHAIIIAENIWIDSDYDGYAEGQVDASYSSGEISSYIWSIGADTIGTGINPQIILSTGSRYLVLTVRNDSGGVSRDSILISVYGARMNTNGAIYSAISQLNQNTFFVSSADDMVYQFDSLGSTKWTYLTGGDIQSTVTVSDAENIFATSSDTRLYSFNYLGTPNWDKAMGGVIVSSPTIDKNNSILVGLTTGRLFAISYDQQIKWSFQTNSPIVASPVIDRNGNVYFGSKDGKVYAVSGNGDSVWTYTTLDSIVSSPAIDADGNVIIGSKDGYLYKLNENGALMWQFNTEGSIYSAPVIGENGQIFIGSESGYFYSLSDSGNLVWKFNTNAPIKSTASISYDGSTIYLGCENGDLLALTIDGYLKWRLMTNGPVVAPTLITENNLLFAGSMDGSVYIMRDPSNLNKPSSDVKLEWPTFLGNNQRTGDQGTLNTDVKKNDPLIEDFFLMQNFPNPFNPSTNIGYYLPEESLVKITIMNILGENIKEFNLGIEVRGFHQFEWNAAEYSSGIYFYKFQVDGINGKKLKSIRKMILMK